MQSQILNRILAHISSFSAVLLIAAVCVLDDTLLIPVDSEPLAIFSILAIVVVYELSIYSNRVVNKSIKTLSDQQKEILHQMEINRLVQAVNGLYGRFIASGDVAITNEYSIKELNELIDMRERLKVNSYTQGRLEYLMTKIVRE